MGMFSRLLGGKKLNSEYLLALDIGTELVKALIFKVDEKTGKGIAIGIGKVRQQLGNMNSGAVSDISGVIQSCEDAIIVAQKMAGVEDVEDTIVGIAGELVKGTTTTVHYERTKPEVRIDIPEIKNIIQKVQWKAFDRIRRQLAWETGHNEIDVQLINASIINVKIDGYRVTNPVGFQGRDVSIGIFNAYAPMLHLGALESIIDELGLKLISVVAEPYAVVKSMGVEDNLDFGAIFIDIGGGTTDIAVVRSGGLEGTVMFALGGRAFTKRISHDLNVEFSRAEDLKIKYATGKLDEKKIYKLNEILEEDCRVWLSGLEIALENFSSSRIDLLPSKILLCGGGSGLPGIYRALNSDNWYRNLPFAKKPTIGFIQPRDVVNIIDKTKMLRNPQDVTPMGLANLAIDMNSDEAVLNDMLKKAVKMIQK